MHIAIFSFNVHFGARFDVAEDLVLIHHYIHISMHTQIDDGACAYQC